MRSIITLICILCLPLLSLPLGAEQTVKSTTLMVKTTVIAQNTTGAVEKKTATKKPDTDKAEKDGMHFKKSTYDIMLDYILRHIA